MGNTIRRRPGDRFRSKQQHKLVECLQHKASFSASPLLHLLLQRIAAADSYEQQG